MANNHINSTENSLTKIVEILQKISTQIDWIDRKFTALGKQQKSSKELTTLDGEIAQPFTARTASNGSNYYFTTLITNEGDKKLFYFDPIQDVVDKMSELEGGTKIKVKGFYNEERDSWNCQELEVKEQEGFSL